MKAVILLEYTFKDTGFQVSLKYLREIYLHFYSPTLVQFTVSRASALRLRWWK